MQATRLLFRIIDNDQTFLLALRKVAIDFIVACEDRMGIPATKSAIYNRRVKAHGDF